MSLNINKKYPAVFFDDRKKRKAMDIIVIHSTNSNNAKGTLSWFQNPLNPAKSSAHYVIARTGVIYKMVDEEDVAFHAGKSEWIMDNKPRIDINYYSLGIEVACDEVSEYTPEQLEALIELCNDIIARRKIKIEMVLRHSDISPKRKRDPYPKNLDWDTFKSKLKPVEHWGKPFEDFMLQHKYIEKEKNLDEPLSRAEGYVIFKNLYEDLTKSK